jgi:hypothetical protein
MGASVGALALLFGASLLAAPPASTGTPKPVVKVVEDPVCPGGTTLQTEAAGTDLRKFCARRDGERQGPFVKIYTPTGTLQEKGSYHAGLLHGAWSKWDTNATLREQGEYHEGNSRGWWVTFHANGLKESAGEYGTLGRKRGTWTTWDEKGKVLEAGEYREGNKHGFWTTYDPATGKVLKQVEYANGAERTR